MLIHNKKEIHFTGIAASPGIAIGQVVVLSKEISDPNKQKISPKEIETEIQKLQNALEKTREELTDIKKRVLHRLGEKDARLFDAHLLILEDRAVYDETLKLIQEKKYNSEWAYFKVMQSFHKTLIKSNDEYLKERALDILDVKRRVVRNLSGGEACLVSLARGLRIVVAHQLTPSQTVLLDRNAILGFAVDLGGKTSHVAILAKGLEKPAVIGLKEFSNLVKDGDKLIVDGNNGRVILNPSKATLIRYRKVQEKYQLFLQKLTPERELPAKTLDGHVLQLAANIELLSEMGSLKDYGAEGVGLFRTEYIYLSKKEFPSEEEQYQEYKKVVDQMYPNSVIIRTFDLGGDRLMVGDLKIEEQNPFLGWRSIRISLDMPDLFITQLRAILRSSTRENVKIMFPMISSVEEVIASKKFLDEAVESLKKDKIGFDPHIEVGIMIEVPAAVLIANQLAKLVDFFSIGTNDLTQYTLAVDRGNERIASLFSAYHPAVLQLIQKTVEAAHDNNIWVGLCGEIAGDPLLLPFLVGIGLDELSITPTLLPEIKKMIRSLRYNSAKRLSDEILQYSSSEDVRNELIKYLKKELPMIAEVLFTNGNL